MRTFIVWDIINRIENAPKEFIGQRKVSLLNSFLFGYDCIYLEVQDEDKLKEKYKDIPSLDEYIRNKYRADHIGSRNFGSIISFLCEDERDYFFNYLAHLKEYEQQFPIEEPIVYVLRNMPRIDLKELLAAIKKRYRMYLPDNSLANLRAFLNGHFQCKKDYHLSLTAFESGIIAFTEQIVCKDLNLTGEYVTWDRKYRYDRDWNSWGETDESDAKKILDSFWKDLEKFTNEIIE